LFAGLDDDSPDDVAHRMGPDGQSALDHLAAAARALTVRGHALDQVLTQERPTLHPALGDAAHPEWTAPAVGGLEEHLVALTTTAEQLASRIAGVPAADWERGAQIAGGAGSTTALDLVWDAVDTAITQLGQAERTIRAVVSRR
jgi:hypothetical protein